ncbi:MULTISPECIES: site-specific integrase [Cupriavidus]|uniref:hypothetical protein n=1 Tax=Cupriavidus sp. WS TaxID=1312922 RepID=UPI0003A3218E|nr:hypothetical protein [Cupriavidus sp. WS]
MQNIADAGHVGRSCGGFTPLRAKTSTAFAASPKLRWHDLRHICANSHVWCGKSPQVPRESGGWKTMEMAQRHAQLSLGAVNKQR